MTSKLKIAAVALMLGAATTTAAGQTPTPEHPFVERFRQMQLLVNGNAGLKPKPVFRDTADAPIGNASFTERFAAMQRDSAGSSVFEDHRTPIAEASADPIGNESFSERFREMQALSSDSGAFGVQPGSSALAKEPNSTLVVAKPPGGVTPPSTPPTL